MSKRALPWYVIAPNDACNGNKMQWSVWDDDCNLVCECFGEDEGHDEAIAICDAINRRGDKVCSNCGEPAACFGSYEDGTHPAYSCGKCCLHGNEDGHCELLEGDDDPS
jgi:hypothetical protein